MHSNFDDDTYKTLQLQQIKTPESASASTLQPTTTQYAPASDAWVTAFNTSLLTTRANQIKDRSSELGELMQSPEFQSLLVAAQHLAQSQGYTKEVATERLIDVFRRIDFSWKQLVMNRGMKTLIGGE
jgi:hypothetical protein